MEKLDRLGWADGISFVSYGVRIGIRVNRPEVLQAIADRLPPGWKPALSPVVDGLYSLRVGSEGPRPGLRHLHLLYAGASRLLRTADLEEALGTLESHLHLAVAAQARRRIFVHAGVVGWRGQAILLPGRSRSGKSTLVAALVRVGATYYSDEYAVLDEKGRVHPYPRPLSLRQEGGQPARRYPVRALGGRAGTRPLPVGLIAVSEYQPGAQWRPRPLSPGKGVLELLANTVPARLKPEASLAALKQVASQAPVLKGLRGEAEPLAHTLLSTLGG
jgi:hypothetical protein